MLKSLGCMDSDFHTYYLLLSYNLFFMSSTKHSMKVFQKLCHEKLFYAFICLSYFFLYGLSEIPWVPDHLQATLPRQDQNRTKRDRDGGKLFLPKTIKKCERLTHVSIHVELRSKAFIHALKLSIALALRFIDFYERDRA